MSEQTTETGQQEQTCMICGAPRHGEAELIRVQAVRGADGTVWTGPMHPACFDKVLGSTTGVDAEEVSER